MMMDHLGDHPDFAAGLVTGLVLGWTIARRITRYMLGGRL
jgi:hypothetical protein